MRYLAAFVHWLGKPFRAAARSIAFMVDLTPRQMQSLCTLALIGGIMANSFWQYLYVSGVRRAAMSGMPFNSPYFEVATNAVKWLAMMSGGFAMFMCLIAFGADWLRFKMRDIEFDAGHDNGPDQADTPKETA